MTPGRSRATVEREGAQLRPSVTAVMPARKPVPGVEGGLLQRHAAGGNQMVLRLLESSRSGAAAQGDELAAQLRSRLVGDAAPLPEVVATPVRTKLSVSQPGDPCEREAEAVASRVVRRASLAPASRMASTSQVAPVARVSRKPATGSSDAGLAGGPGLSAVESALGGSGGQAMDPSVLERVEPYVGVDLSGARVRQGPEADAAAKALGARAFTSGSTIFLADGESPTDLELMAHEAAHVAQQHTGAAVQPLIMRDISVTDVIPDFILDGVKSAVTAIPGYTLLTLIIGTDPLTDRPVRPSREELVEELLTYGPFGAAVGQVLQTIEVLGDVFALVTDGLAANNLTLDRIGRDIDAAWEEFTVTNGVSGNVAIVERYVDAILRDVGAFVRSIVDRVIEIVRSVIAEVAEPFLERPEIKPVWDLAKKVLHYDPLRGEAVNAPTVEILGDFLRLIGQEQRLAQMTERGTLLQAADWLDTQFATFASIVNDLGTLFADAWAAIQPQNLPQLLDTLPPLAQRAFGLVQRIGNFATTVIGKVLELVKQSLLGWLSEHAHQLPGFHLLTVILGQNPFTGQAVPRTAENLIKGFITLMPNGEATYQQLAESGVISEAATRIESAMSRLGISVDLIVNTFLGIWNTLSLDDLLAPIAAFERVLAQFREPLGRIIEFVAEVIKVVITLILRLMNFPSDLLGSIISNAMQAIDDIQRDPVAFILNMLQALKTGFMGFFDNILNYLLQGLTSWLFRGLGQIGITIPPDLTLKSILDLVLQVLGVSIEQLWQKLGQHIGPERVAMIRGAIDRLTGAWAFIKDVQERGITAIWEYVVDKLSGLWDTILDMAKNWIVTEIVEKVVTKLISMLDPTGIMAVVNSFIAFFNAIQSAIEYLRDILGIVNDYVTTFAQVAAGNIAPGAQRITQGLANAVPIAIGFLANQVGIGNVPEKIVEIIQGLRQLVDEALDWLFEQAIRLGQAALSALGIGGPADPATPGGTTGQIHEHFDIAGRDHEIYIGPSGTLMIASDPQPVSNLAKLQSLHAQYQALPATATDEQKRALILQMVQLVKSDPTLIAQLSGAGEVSPVAAAVFHSRVVDRLKQVAQAHPVAGEQAQTLYDGLYAELGRNPGRGSNDDLLRLLPAVWRALRDPDAIADVVTDIWVEAHLLGKVAPQAAMSRYGAAAAQLTKSTGAGIVTLARGREFDGESFYQQVVIKGYRFLDLAVLDISEGHGATTHLIQDLVVDRVLKGSGKRAEELRALFANARGDNDAPIGRWLWEEIFDSLKKGVNDPNYLYPALRELLPGLE